MRSSKRFTEDNGACGMGGHLPSLDFAGLSVLFGTSATKAGIPYSCLVRSRVPYLNAYVTGGTLGLAQAVLSCIDWRPTRILMGASEAGSMLELCGVKASGDASYVGLQSATSAPVRGVVGEAVVLEVLREGKRSVSCTEDHSLIGRDAGRLIYVVWAVIREPDTDDDEMPVTEEEQGALISMLATLLCALVLVLNGLCNEWIGFSLMTTGMFLNAMMAFLLRQQKFQLAGANPARDAPPGDSVILLKNDPDVFCVLRGNERVIQRLLQKEVVLKAGHIQRLLLFLVSLALIGYSAVVVLGMPHMGATAQLLFLLAVCIGAIVDLLKGSWNGKRAIAKAAISKYEIVRVSAKRFGNRTAAVAAVAAGSTRLDALKAVGLLPTAGPVWENWWTALGSHCRAADGSQDQEEPEKLKTRAPMSSQDEKLWAVLEADMTDGLQGTV